MQLQDTVRSADSSSNTETINQRGSLAGTSKGNELATARNPIHAQYAYLFNSYYNAAGKMHCRPKRGLISRPTLRETMEYRREVDGMMDAVFEKSAVFEKFAPVIRLGLHYEQQHQELILTDIKHVFSENPLRPVFL